MKTQYRIIQEHLFFFHYLFEQVGYDKILELVETQLRGYQALDKILSTTAFGSVNELFENWGLALLIGNQNQNPAWSYNHEERSAITVNPSLTVSQLPERKTFLLPPFTHQFFQVPFVSTLSVDGINNDNLNIHAAITYPMAPREYIASVNNSWFFSNRNPHNVATLVLSNTSTSRLETNTTLREDSVAIILYGNLSANIIELAYDDGEPDIFYDRASYLLLQEDEEILITFFPDDDSWIQGLSLNVLFLNELQNSELDHDVIRSLDVRLFEINQGEPDQPITDKITWELKRGHGSIGFETIPLSKFYDSLKSVNDAIGVQLSNTSGNKNLLAIAMDSSGYNHSFYRKKKSEWNGFNKMEINGRTLAGWNPMIRLQVVKQRYNHNALVVNPIHTWDSNSLQVRIPNVFHSKEERNRLIVVLPTGEVVNGQLANISEEVPTEFVYNLPLQVGGSYQFYSLLQDDLGLNEHVDSWNWELPVSEGLVLQSNYPNPFNSSTNISFLLLDQAETIITIYDVLGRKVKRIKPGILEQGHHDIAISFNGLASGVYLTQVAIHLSDGRGFVQKTQKVLLVK